MKKTLSVVLAVLLTCALALTGCDTNTTKVDLSVTVSGVVDGKIETTYDGHSFKLQATTDPADKTLTVLYAGASGTEYAESATAPAEAGTYTVSISYAGDSGVNPYTHEPLTLVIKPATPALTVEVASIVYGKGKIEPTVTNPSGGQVSLKYAGRGDTTYDSSTAPTEGGEYTVTASLAASRNYTAVSATDDFAITPADGALTIEVDDVTYGTAVEPEVVSKTGDGAVTFKYKGRGDTTYAESDTAPTAVGTYTAVGTLAATRNHTTATAEANFEIAKAQGSLTIACDNVTVGETPAPHVESEVGTGAVTFKYKGRGATEYAESDTAPTAAGTYTVVGTLAETETHTSATAEADFEIYLPARTDVPTEAPVKKSAFTGIDVLDDTIAVEPKDDTEFRATSATHSTEWSASGVFTDLLPNTEYTIEARRPANESNGPSAAGAQTLTVKTLDNAILSNAETSVELQGVVHYILSEEQNHTKDGSKSYKATGEQDCNLFQPQWFMTKYGGSWTKGDADENWIDLSGYRYLSFWVYTEAENIVLRTNGLEFWHLSACPGVPQNGVYVNGASTALTAKAWTRVILDMNSNTYPCNMTNPQDIWAKIAQIAIGVDPDATVYYLDDIVLMQALEA